MKLRKPTQNMEPIHIYRYKDKTDNRANKQLRQIKMQTEKGRSKFLGSLGKA